MSFISLVEIINEKDKAYWKEFAVALLFVGLGMAAPLLAGAFLQENYPNDSLLRTPDLLHDNLAPIDFLVTVGDTFSLILVLLFSYTTIKNRLQELPEFLTKVGMMYIFRALNIILTPLKSIHGVAAEGTLPLMNMFNYGMFYSGHTAFAFMVYFLDKNDGSAIKRVKLFLAIGVATFLVLSHHHYAIDVTGGFLAAYFFSRLDLAKLSPGRLFRK
ncbi:MAG: hypothetical protein ACOCXP_01925 [Candidatus Dojkabacteria bacterium]